MDIKELYKIYEAHPVITTDSRDVPEGSIFFALKGESFNGNMFALNSLQKGAAYAVVDEELAFLPGWERFEGRLIRVDNVLQTFKDLAREHRRHFNIPVIGITGTNGKTTTKELIAAVLSKKYNVMYTQGNFNNDVGVPKTLFRLRPEHDIAVVEMGASHPGDIKTLVETAEPTCGLITNVGRAHLQGFGSFEGVKKTKGELYDYSLTPLPHSSALRAKRHPAGCRALPSERGNEYSRPFMFLNTKDADLVEMAEERGVQTVPYVNGGVQSCNPFLNVKVGACRVIRTKLVGAYNAVNVLAAYTVGKYFKVPVAGIVDALENYTPSNNRSQLTVTEHNHLIVDAYNANPTSMAAAIENFRIMQVDAPKMAILGDMRELGDVSLDEHRKIVDMLKAARFDQVWLVGDEFAQANDFFQHYNNVEEVKAAIQEKQPEGCYILIKGSNGIKLYQLPEML